MKTIRTYSNLDFRVKRLLAKLWVNIFRKDAFLVLYPNIEEILANEVPVPPPAPPVHGGYCAQCHDPLTQQQAEDHGLCSRCMQEAEISAIGGTGYD